MVVIFLLRMVYFVFVDVPCVLLYVDIVYGEFDPGYNLTTYDAKSINFMF